MRPRQRFDRISPDAIDAIASLFDTNPLRQPFQLPASNDHHDADLGVWAIHYRSESGNLKLLLWPALDRIDVAVGPHMWIVTGVHQLEVIDDLEVIARFGYGGTLTVALNGQIVLSARSELPDGSQPQP